MSTISMFTTIDYNLPKLLSLLLFNNSNKDSTYNRKQGQLLDGAAVQSDINLAFSQNLYYRGCCIQASHFHPQLL